MHSEKAGISFLLKQGLNYFSNSGIQNTVISSFPSWQNSQNKPKLFILFISSLVSFLQQVSGIASLPSFTAKWTFDTLVHVQSHFHCFLSLSYAQIKNVFRVFRGNLKRAGLWLSLFSCRMVSGNGKIFRVMGLALVYLHNNGRCRTKKTPKYTKKLPETVSSGNHETQDNCK